ncbi:peptidoglycan-binding protein [Loktanella sp. DJP18]|uniref:peptidoglycan-binding domain-containing protein n=1 Tax=Loktanella sp. DJP18 TaxID=3409788 RepID=UPI003BB728DB
MRQLLLSSVMICAASLAQAQDAALIVGISNYDTLRDLRGANDLANAGADIEANGFAVFGTQRGVDLQAQANDFADMSVDADRLVAALAGRFVTDGQRTWLLPTDAATPAAFSVANGAISVETLLAQLERTPGAAVLILGRDPGDDRDIGGGLRSGIGDLDLPSGVTVVQGTVSAAADLLRDVVAVPGGDIVAAVRRDRDLSASGFVPGRLVLVSEGSTAAPPAPAAPRPSVTPDLAATLEGTFWDTVRTADNEAGYTRYLDRYPQGPHAADAVARLRDLRDPDRSLRAAEDALNLPLEARRAIQRDFQVLGFDTRGIDGIFGPGTRGAIKAWQGQNNAAQSGYLAAGQIALIDRQAATRAAELEAQAQARREATLRDDRAFWANSGATGTEAGLRSYLERYPDGQFSDQAKAALDTIQQRNRAAAAESDRQTWDRAVRTGNAGAYRAYLEEHPNGAFKDEANARIAQFQRASAEQAGNDAAAAAERALALDPVSLRLVEARLSQLGLDPGAVDGSIDADTRNAIRRYQRDRQLTVSGYLDQSTVSQMLTDAFR